MDKIADSASQAGRRGGDGKSLLLVKQGGEHVSLFAEVFCGATNMIFLVLNKQKQIVSEGKTLLLRNNLIMMAHPEKRPRIFSPHTKRRDVFNF